MSAFVLAMDCDAKQRGAKSSGGKTRGENGAPEYTVAGAGDPRVALFYKLVRGLAADDLRGLVRAVEDKFEETRDVALLVDLFLLAFQTRATRGDGKGEKALFVELLLVLHGTYPLTVCRLVELVPAYGYWKDLLLLLEQLAAAGDGDEAIKALEARILAIFAAKLDEDDAKLRDAVAAGERPALSLAAKWAPREGRHFGAQAKALASILFPRAPDDAAARRLYRRRVASLNRALETAEVLMSAHRYSELAFERVPALCLKRNRKAFLNERVKGKLTLALFETGDRFPDDADRVDARKKLRKIAGRPGGLQLHGAALQPHEIAREAMKKGRSTLSAAEVEVLDAQWESLRASVREQLAKVAAERVADCVGDGADDCVARAPNRIDLGKLVALVDVSGSMAGTPMEVAIALGILVSELSEPGFAHRVLTFEAKPRWVDLSSHRGIVAKVRATRDAPWGGNTNFARACDRILDAAVEAKLTPDQIPDLIVFSDMQFDAAGGLGSSTWETHFERLQRRFNEVGRKVCGQPYPAPRIIFWNLRANTVGLPAQAGSPNVQLLSGFSPALLKLVLQGEELVAIEDEVAAEDGKARVLKVGPTPYTTLRQALDAPAFDAVRVAIADVGEGALCDYECVTFEGFAAV
ncbi:hypothetical protein KFE25_007203 [Diacronema lutheri]|uniref:VWFA domain-containing protein n=1 Tax=Diacronema lutheri TaxID=2081491 RepID=A0A8J5XSI0_DIALT|nr:hypothetical protein KFE25_007203 [Diacronema lutheri]